MTKKVIALILSTLLIISLACCGIDSAASVSCEKRIEVVYVDRDLGVRIFKDNETNVAYLWRIAGNGAGLTTMLDPDGKPLIWE